VVAASPSYASRIAATAHRRPADDVRAVAAAQDALLAGDEPDAAVRNVVMDSWLRSAAAGVDADRNVAPVVLDPDALADYRAEHPLSRVFPLLYDVLGRAVEACESVLAIADVHGRLLWVCGRPKVLMRAESINFVEGASWDENRAGTNAPGTALRLDSAVQIHGPEHFTRAVQRWSCAAAPIHDPDTQAILGVVDVTGGGDIDSPQTLAMVRAAARMAEAEIGRLNAIGLHNGLIVPAGARDNRLVLEGLGRADCQLDDGRRVIRLSRRHSEILTILADYPDGLTSEQLAVELYDDDAALSTVRAEMTRVRALLGESVVDSRPYRLRVPVESDWRTVENHLTAGRLADAMRCYRGPLLPQSDAPGISTRRDRLERQLRQAVLQSGSVDLMIAWTRARWGAEDLEMWQRQHRLLPAESPLRPIATAEIARLNVEYGIPRRG
jgi:transcriptional regulator of acetoin/glycerol metabolism